MIFRKRFNLLFDKIRDNPGIGGNFEKSSFFSSVKKIYEDGILNGTDNEELKKALNEYNENIAEQKRYLNQILDTTLKKGYTVENKETYDIFANLLLKVKKYKIPSFSEVYNANFNKKFSLKYFQKNKIGFFNATYLNGNIFGYSNLNDGKFISYNHLVTEKVEDLSDYFDLSLDNNRLVNSLNLKSIYELNKKHLDNKTVDVDFEYIKSFTSDKKISFLEKDSDAEKVSWIFSRFDSLYNSQKKFLEKNFDEALKNGLEFDSKYGFDIFMNFYKKLKGLNFDSSNLFEKIVEKNSGNKKFFVFSDGKNLKIVSKNKDEIFLIGSDGEIVFSENKKHNFSVKNIGQISEEYRGQGFLLEEDKQEKINKQSDDKNIKIIGKGSDSKDFEKKIDGQKPEKKLDNQNIPRKEIKPKISKNKKWNGLEFPLSSAENIISKFEKINYNYKIFEKNTKGKNYSEDVVALQSALNILNNANLRIDGDFGEETYAKLLEFQRDNKILNDGRIGEQTRKKNCGTFEKTKKLVKFYKFF